MGKEKEIFFGWQIILTGERLCIGIVEGRKSYCLYSWIGTVATPLAYFRNKESAESAILLLRKLIKIQSTLVK